MSAMQKKGNAVTSPPDGWKRRFVAAQDSPETDREGWCSPEFSGGCVLQDDPKLWEKDNNKTQS